MILILICFFAIYITLLVMERLFLQDNPTVSLWEYGNALEVIQKLFIMDITDSFNSRWTKEENFKYNLLVTLAPSGFYYKKQLYQLLIFYDEMYRRGYNLSHPLYIEPWAYTILYDVYNSHNIFTALIRCFKLGRFFINLKRIIILISYTIIYNRENSYFESFSKFMEHIIAEIKVIWKQDFNINYIKYGNK